MPNSIKAQVKPLTPDRISPGTKIPKYLQVQRILTDYLASVPPSVEFLPFEDEISVLLGVSRRTVRRAMEELRKAGLVQTARKSGSRILRGPLAAKPVELPGKGLASVAVILASDKEDDRVVGKDLRWQMVAELENRLLPRGSAVVLYNIRENHFQKWRDSAKLIASLHEKGIRFAVLVDNVPILIPSLTRDLLAAGIKPVLFQRDMPQKMEDFTDFIPGSDHLLVNHAPKLDNTLRSHFTDRDLIVCAVNKKNLYWADSRFRILEKTAAELGIPVERAIEQDEAMGKTRTREEEAAFAQQVLTCLRRGKKAVCFCANDAIAARLLVQFNALGIDIPGEFKILGYDNNPHRRELNFSTFETDMEQLTDALVDLYAEFLRDPAASLTASRGRMVYSRYIPRGTT